jgi:hypothetical protein
MMTAELLTPPPDYATLNPTMPTPPRPAATHGGVRAGAGRKSIFGAKALRKPYAMDFTPQGRKALATLERRTKLSRNAIIGSLALQFADALVFDGDTPFPGKQGSAVLSIRVPPEAGAKLAAARVRTGCSYSDIGEALVRWYGRAATFPTAGPQKARRRARASR